MQLGTAWLGLDLFPRDSISQIAQNWVEIWWWFPKWQFSYMKLDWCFLWISHLLVLQEPELWQSSLWHQLFPITIWEFCLFTLIAHCGVMSPSTHTLPETPFPYRIWQPAIARHTKHLPISFFSLSCTDLWLVVSQNKQPWEEFELCGVLKLMASLPFWTLSHSLDQDYNQWIGSPC